MIEPDSIAIIDDIPVLYVRKVGKYSEAGVAAWEALADFMDSADHDRSQLRYFGVALDDPGEVEESKLRYDACIASAFRIEPKGEVQLQVLKGGKYAILFHRGSFNTLSETYKNIFEKWLPQTNEKQDKSRGILQEYLNLEYVNSDPSKVQTKIFIPVI
jgi:AraC family transcriptional regulator